MANILIVEDDKKICEIIEDYLIEDGHNCFISNTGVDIIDIFNESNPDLVILDLMLPQFDGYTICKLIRAISNIPIIILTAKSEEIDKLKGYELGADDYITKPFSPRVLTAKVKALLKRTSQVLDDENIVIGNININLNSRTTVVRGENIELTYKEFELLYTFMKNPNRVFTREYLLSNIWGYDYIGNTRTVDTHIKTLRKKLGEDGIHIVTMIRSGYKFEV